MESILKQFEYGEYLKPTECTNSILVVEAKKMGNKFTFKPSIGTAWEKK